MAFKQAREQWGKAPNSIVATVALNYALHAYISIGKRGLLSWALVLPVCADIHELKIVQALCSNAHTCQRWPYYRAQRYGVATRHLACALGSNIEATVGCRVGGVEPVFIGARCWCQQRCSGQLLVQRRCKEKQVCQLGQTTCKPCHAKHLHV
jgi:hypothetical protein